MIEFAEAPAQSGADGVIDATSIDTRVAQRDTHLHAAEFFDVARFAKITFTETNIEPLDAPRAGDG